MPDDGQACEEQYVGWSLLGRTLPAVFAAVPRGGRGENLFNSGQIYVQTDSLFRLNVDRDPTWLWTVGELFEWNGKMARVAVREDAGGHDLHAGAVERVEYVLPKQ